MPFEGRICRAPRSVSHPQSGVTRQERWARAETRAGVATKTLFSRTRRWRAGWRSAPRGRDRGVGCGGWRVRSHAPRPGVQTHRGFQLAPLQPLVLMARAGEAEFLQEPGEACLDHGERAGAPRPASCPAAGGPCVRVRIPGEAEAGCARPSLLGRGQVTGEPPTCGRR